jgi:hypothetical protein
MEEGGPSQPATYESGALQAHLVTDDGEVEAELSDPFRRLIEAAGAPMRSSHLHGHERDSEPLYGAPGFEQDKVWWI